MKLLISFIFVCFTLSLTIAQSINIDNNTVFRDGVYASYEDFLHNDPSYAIESFEIKWKDTPFFNMLKMKSCKSYKNGKIKKTDLRQIWGICVNGVPYIQYSIGVPYSLQFGNKALELNGNLAFSRIRILGNICHFNVEDVYKTRTKSVFRSKAFTNEVSGRMIRAQRLLKLSTGKVFEYDEFVLSQLIKDDELLANQYKKEKDRPHKMFLYLQKYNERNPLVNTSILAKQ
jgi:hypothetical protein